MKDSQYRDLLDELPDFVCLHDLSGKLLEINSAFRAILGYDEESMINRSIREFIHPAYQNQFEGYLNDILKKGEVSGIMAMRDVSGQTHLLDFHSKLLTRNGKPVGVRAVARDISEQKRMEKALRENETLYRTLFENSEDAIFLLEGGVFVDCNPRALAMFGGEKKDIVGKFPYHISPELQPDGQPSKQKALERVQAALKGESQRFEWRHSRLDGTPLDTIVSLYKIVLNNREILVAIVHDITSQKKATEALANSERNYREVVEYANIIILRYTPEGVFTFVNRFAEEFFGFSREELVGKRKVVGTVLPETGPDSGELKKMFRDICDHPESYYENENKNITKDGREVFISWRNQPIRDEQGNIKEILSFGVDVTRVRQLENELLQAKKLEAVGTLAGGIAHDFNNILGGVMGYVSLLKEQHKREDFHYNILEKIEAAGEEASDLVKQLLAFSRRGKFESKPVNMNLVIKSVLDILKHSIPKKIRIETSLDENLPSVEGDPSQMNQVIMNTCLNAIHAMPEGGILKIETFSISQRGLPMDISKNAHHDLYVGVNISDTGIGMDASTKEHIFEPFFTTKKFGGGTGLGLSTVYGIVKNHEGEILVESEMGRGSTFKIYLPAKQDLFHDEAGKRKGRLVQGEGRILVVDDEDIFREMLKDVLVFLGYDVLTAQNGCEGIEVYKKHLGQIDLVILDMNMPVMDGREMFNEIKKIDPEVNALLTTGFTLDGEAQELMNEGVMGFIQKPFKMSDISKAVEALIQSG